MRYKILFACSSLFFGVMYSQDYKSILKGYLAQKSASFKKSGLNEFEIDNVDKSASLKADIVKIQQTYNGIPVFQGVGTAVVKDEKVLHFSDNLERNFTNASSKMSSKTSEEILSKFLNENHLQQLAGKKIINFGQKKEEDGEEVIRSRNVYYKNEKTENLILSYEYIYHDVNEGKSWSVILDASTGQILEKIPLTVSCDFGENPYSREALPSKDPLPQNLGDPKNVQSLKTLSATGNASYHVFALPLEAPTFGARTIVTNPWNLASSPEGWHSNGTIHYTYTRGNNVFAYSDKYGNDKPEYFVEGGNNLIFDFPFNINIPANDNKDAAITNLFYTNNMVHDISYQFGFTETARNFQDHNFGKGGVEGDFVKAEAQDGGGFNNANFSISPDGNNGIMQMYLWSLSSTPRLVYNMPSEAVSRKPKTSLSTFGVRLSSLEVTADLALPNIKDGCTPIAEGSLNSHIALLDEGSCTPVLQVKNAQNAGADAVIIVNHNDELPDSIGGTDQSISIPTVVIDKTEGDYLKALLTSGTKVNVTLKDKAIYRDGSFDNGIVSHEYGHGISTRLTGNGYSCLNTNVTQEQMGEGWSDFLALMLTNQPGDNASVPRGIGTFAFSENPDGLGIRQAKYSPDFSINDLTYGKIKDYKIFHYFLNKFIPHVHAIGVVWATILWDLHWAYVNKYGYSSNISANPESGSGRIFQLVMDGMKLQECNPTFVSGRNALLAADQLSTGGENRCLIWNAFAKRGVGFKASAGAKDILEDVIEDFSLPLDCAALGTEDAVANKSLVLYPNPTQNEFHLKLPQNAKGRITVDVYDTTGKLVLFTTTEAGSSVPISTAKLPAGVYMVKVTGLDMDLSTKLILNK